MDPRPRTRRPPVGSFAALLVAAWCCTPQVRPEPAPQAGPRPADRLLDSVGEAHVEGRAAGLLAEDQPVHVQRLLDLDFEGGTEGLVPAPSGCGGAGWRSSGIEVAPGPSGRGSALRLRGSPSGAQVVHTAPMPVEPGSRLSLSWSVLPAGAARPGDPGSGAVTLEFYAVGEHHRSVRRYLRDPEHRKGARRPSTAAHEVVRPGPGGWSTRAVRIDVPEEANVLVVSLQAQRHGEGEPGSDTPASVWFDDVTVEAEGTPPHVRLASPGLEHPLAVRVALPAAGGDEDVRDALFAPAPSRIRFERDVPAGARLTLATAVLPEGPGPAKGDHALGVVIEDASGSRTEVARWIQRPEDREGADGWIEREVTLAPWAGQRVHLELESARAPGATGIALWGHPVLSRGGDAGRLVLLVVLDTQTVSHLSAYGAARETTPSLARLARSGVLFEAAYAPSPWTLPSIATVLTGLDPSRHGAGERHWGSAVWRRPLGPEVVTLAERLRDAGFDTAGFVNNPYLTRAFGVDRGFSTWRTYGADLRSGDGRAGVDLALEWLRAHRGRDRFLVVHFLDSHGPYRPPRRLVLRFASSWLHPLRGDGHRRDLYERAFEQGPASLRPADRVELRDLYDAALAATDAELGRLLHGVRGMPGERLVAVVGDHGEEHFEHGAFEHGHQLYEELLRVPLVLSRSPPLGEPRRISERVLLADVAPTVLDFVGLGESDGGDGRSLLPWLGERPPARQPDRAVLAGTTLYGAGGAAIIAGTWKYIYQMAGADRMRPRVLDLPRHQLFDLRSDPGEVHDLSGKATHELRSLHVTLDTAIRAGVRDRDVLLLDGGGRVHRWSGELVLAAGKGWSRNYEDVVAPSRRGGAAPLRVTVDGRRFAFEARADRVVLAARRLDGEDQGPVEVRLARDGVPWTADLRLPGDEAACPGSGPCIPPALQSIASPSVLPPPTPEARGAWYLRAPARSAMARTTPTRRVTEELRALGYVE